MLAGAAFAVSLLACLPALADPIPAAAPPLAPEPEKPKAVRLALSAEAGERLVELRVKRLMAIELASVAELSQEANGPLGEDVVRVWIHVPAADRALIEVRRTDRALARRLLDIGGFPGDLAARVVAIAASEMVRVQARASARRPPSEGPGAGKGEGEGHGDERFSVGGQAHLMLLPSSRPLALFGSELSLAHRHGITAQTLYGRWLMGDGSRRARWFEVGASFDVRLPLAERWTLLLAAKVGGVAASLPQAEYIENRRTDSDWTVRAGGVIGVEAAIGEATALTLGLEPGASLRTLHAVDRAGAPYELGGFALGIGLGISASPAPTSAEPKHAH